MIRIAIFGGGWVFDNVWWPVLSKFQELSVDCLIDPNPSVQKKISLLNKKIKVLSKVEEVNLKEIDLALIITPNYLHFELAVYCLQKGVHVFVEKPACFNKKQAEKLINLSLKKSLGIWVSDGSLHRNDIRAMNDIVKSKEIGDIRCIDVSWLRASGIPNLGSWFTSYQKSLGGVGVDLGWHVLSVALSLVDYPIVISCIKSLVSDVPTDRSVNADWYSSAKSSFSVAGQNNLDVETQAYGALFTENEQIIRFSVAWVSHEPCDKTSVYVYGSKGTVKLDTTFGFSSNNLKNTSMSVIKRGVEETIHIEKEKKLAPYFSAMEKVILDINNKIIPNNSILLSMGSTIERMYAEKKVESSVLDIVKS